MVAGPARMPIVSEIAWQTDRAPARARLDGRCRVGLGWRECNFMAPDELRVALTMAAILNVSQAPHEASGEERFKLKQMLLRYQVVSWP